MSSISCKGAESLILPLCCTSNHHSTTLNFHRLSRCHSFAINLIAKPAAPPSEWQRKRLKSSPKTSYSIVILSCCHRPSSSRRKKKLQVISRSKMRMHITFLVFLCLFIITGNCCNPRRNAFTMSNGSMHVAIVTPRVGYDTWIGYIGH